MKILFAMDGSPASMAGLRALLTRYDWFRGPPVLTLLNVHPPIPYGLAARWVGKQTIADHCAEESTAVLAPAREELDRRGIAYTTEARMGEPAREIAALADALAVDMIAMGTHGHTALGTLVLGSVAQKVVALAHVPVLLLK